MAVYRLYTDDTYQSFDFSYTRLEILPENELIELIKKFREENFNETRNKIQISGNRELRADEIQDLGL